MAKNQTTTKESPAYDVDLFDKSRVKLEKAGTDKGLLDSMSPEQVIGMAKILCQAENPKTIATREAEEWKKVKEKAEPTLDGVFSKLAPIAKMNMGNHRVDWSKSSSIQFNGYRLEYGIRFFNPTNDADYQTQVATWTNNAMSELEAEVKRNRAGISRYANYKMQDEKNSPALTFGMVQHDAENGESLRATITVKKVLTE